MRLHLSLTVVGLALSMAVLWAGLVRAGVDSGDGAAVVSVLHWAVVCGLCFAVARALAASEVLIGPAGSLALTPFPKRYLARDRYSLVVRTAMISLIALPLYLLVPAPRAYESSLAGFLMGSPPRAWVTAFRWYPSWGDSARVIFAALAMLSDLSWYPLLSAWGLLVGVRAAKPPEERAAAFWAGAGCFAVLMAVEWMLAHLVLLLAPDYSWRCWYCASPRSILLLMFLTAALSGSFVGRMMLARMFRERAARELDRAELLE
jgi:hypothetical protein